jgi:phage antirepressor YoqD-like protein
MNALIAGGFDAALRMTSQEIAELVEKRHDNVKRTIEALANQGVIVRPQIEDIPGEDAMGRPRVTQVHVFTGERGKRDSIVVVARLSPEFTARLVDRWQELEIKASTPQLPDFTNPAIAARAWADQVEQRQALEQKVEQDAPKVDVYDRITEAEGSLCLRDAAKALQIQPNKLNAWLQANGWIYRRVGKGGWLGYQDKLQSGHLMHKVTPYIDETNGESRVSEQVRVTPKGLTRIAALLNKTAPRKLRPHDQGSPHLGMH